MPLFSTYSASAVNARLEASGVKAIVADRVLVERARKSITPSTSVFLLEGDHINRIEGRVTQFWSSLYEAEPWPEAATYDENDPFIMTYSAKTVEPRYGLQTRCAPSPRSSSVCATGSTSATATCSGT